MFIKKSITFIFIFLSIFFFSFQANNNNWTIGDNEIIINNYISKLSEEDRDNYYYWTGLRNSFYYSEDSNQLEKLVKYFTPEDDNYYQHLFRFSTPGFICAGCVIVIFILYIVKRFVLKGCKGPKIIVRSYNIATIIYLAIGFLIGVIFLSLTIYNAAKSK
jgi:hypothetical protein